LNAESSFISLKACFGSFEIRFLVWIMLSALVYHLLAGLKHLFMDLGFLESIKGSRYSSFVVFALSLVIIIALGVGIIW
jgi:succinate dehydrogenase / fumarate reductase cytochrome b subunit